MQNTPDDNNTPLWAIAFERVIEYVREFNAEEIDDAYEYFWEEEEPEEFLSGMALEIGFHNFEDWLVCDYRNKELEGKGVIDRCIEGSELEPDKIKVLHALRDSIISLYEVAEVKGDTVKLNDLALKREVTLKEPRACALNVGEIFAARIVDIGGTNYMTHAVYPFSARVKDKVLEYLDKLYTRYAKHNKDATMAGFLKSEAYTFNTIWTSCLYKIS